MSPPSFAGEDKVAVRGTHPRYWFTSKEILRRYCLARRERWGYREPLRDCFVAETVAWVY
jgi:hypothetical protein